MAYTSLVFYSSCPVSGRRQLQFRIKKRSKLVSNKIERVKVFFHWLMAINVFFLFMSSWWMLALPLPSENFTFRELPFQLHKSIGITIFVIAIYLLGVRVSKIRRKAFKSNIKSERFVEKGHLVLYFLITFCCISGYLSSSYSGWGTTLWWSLDLPLWAEENDSLNILFSDLHLWSCWALLLVIAGHVGVALYHAFRSDLTTDKMYRW